MSMASHAVGARFMSLIGAPMVSFYDWYADLPIASPQVFGDQTDVPESGDWWDRELVPGKFLTAADLELDTDDEAAAAWKPVLLDAASGRPVVPNGTLGDRWSKGGTGRWNLDWAASSRRSPSTATAVTASGC